jgi:hypothetical protein
MSWKAIKSGIIIKIVFRFKASIFEPYLTSLKFNFLTNGIDKIPTPWNVVSTGSCEQSHKLWRLGMWVETEPKVLALSKRCLLILYHFGISTPVRCLGQGWYIRKEGILLRVTEEERRIWQSLLPSICELFEYFSTLNYLPPSEETTFSWPWHVPVVPATREVEIGGL